MKRHERCSIRGRCKPTVKYHYFHRFFTYSVRRRLTLASHPLSTKHRAFHGLCDSIRGPCQAGSLTGAVHLSKANAGVLRPAQRGQKPRVEQKGKSWLDLDFQYEYRPRKRGLSILLTLGFRSRGVRKVTTGITGLWRPSVHSDVAF